MTQTILTLSVAYGLLIVLAMLMVFNSRLPLILRAGLTVVVAALVFYTYWGIGEIRGLPSDTAPPDRFRLYWAQITEPDKLSGKPGSIFLWIGELDEDFYPVGMPRAHKLPYSEELATLVIEAQQQISNGEQIAGEVNENPEETDTEEELATEVAEDNTESNSTRVGERYISFDFGNLEFVPAPAPVTPEKRN